VGRTLAAAVLFMLFVALPVQAASHAGTRTVTIRLISTGYEGQTVVDRAPKHVVSKGDVIVVTSFLRNAVAQFGRAKGVVVGGDSATFTVLTRTHAALRVEMSLPGGTLSAGGRVRLGAVQTYAVTGGTGRFVRARGAGESRPLPNKWGGGDRRVNVYRLRLP
jgi:Dirigent-like protein